MSVDVELDSNIIISGNSEINSEIDIEMSTNQEIEVYIEPREYKVVGDDVYIPINFDDAPPWLTNTITNLTNISTEEVVTNLNELVLELTYAVSEVELAKNRYEQSITDYETVDSKLLALLTTMNSSMDGLDASLKDLIATKTTASEASVVALEAISTAMNDTSTGSTLGSAILNLQTSITNLNTSTNTSIESLESSINGAVDASAQAIETINTYVGIDGAGASTNTGLSAYLEDSTGNLGGADSNVANSVYVDGLGNTRSKFEYNSNLSYNGYNYQSGFGLATALTDSSIPVGESEFWINASKFKFTNTNQTGQVAPFTIDASGVTPQIYFNGRVQFSNVDGYTAPDVSGDISANNDTFAQKLGYLSYSAMVAATDSGQTIINGGYVNTSLLQANSINAGMINTVGLIAENISANEVVGKIITGAVINGAVIKGAVVKASYLDLDGELEVLTNYHITPAMYNANPSLYTDAVYLSGSNEYRIPSISNISSLQKQMVSTSPYISAGNYTLTSNLYSYASANVGNNMKVVKVRPTIIHIESSPSSTIPENYLYNAIFKSVSSGSGYFRFYIGDLLILALIKSNNSVSYSGLAGNGSIASPSINANITVNLSYGGMIFSISRMNFYGDGISIEYSGATNLQIIDNWTSGQIRVEADSQVQSHPQGNFNSLIGFRLPAISINNMI